MTPHLGLPTITFKSWLGKFPFILPCLCQFFFFISGKGGRKTRYPWMQKIKPPSRFTTLPTLDPANRRLMSETQKTSWNRELRFQVRDEEDKAEAPIQGTGSKGWGNDSLCHRKHVDRDDSLKWGLIDSKGRKQQAIFIDGLECSH